MPVYEAESKHGRSRRMIEIKSKNMIEAREQARFIHGWTGKVERKSTHREIIFGDYPDIMI